MAHNSNLFAKKLFYTLTVCIFTNLAEYPGDKAVLVALKTVRAWLEDKKNKQQVNRILHFCALYELNGLVRPTIVSFKIRSLKLNVYRNVKSSLPCLFG